MSERTIANLLNCEGRVYVYLRGTNLAKIFLKQAAAEGFTFGDGADPQSREASDIFALNDDFTINYVGWVGHMAFYSTFSDPASRLVRVDFGKYLSGSENYIITDKSQL